MEQSVDQLSMGNYHDICSRTDGIGTHRTETEHSADSYHCRFSMQRRIGRTVFYRNRTSTGQYFQRPIFYSHIRHTDGEYAFEQRNSTEYLL